MMKSDVIEADKVSGGYDMDLFSKLKAIVSGIKNKRATFGYPVDKQKEFLYSLPEPKDDFERSYFQYKCQNKLYGRLFSLIANTVSFILLILFYIKPYHKLIQKQISQNCAIFLSNDIPKNIIPSSLNREFEGIQYGNNLDYMFLSKSDKKFIRKMWSKYPFSYYFIFKCMMKISMYSAQFEIHNPKAIITYAEYSFTSSILTTYCMNRGVEHINIMHGEKLFDITDSFFRFSRCYVWDESYKDLFINLRAYKDQFIVEIPPSLKMDLNKSINPSYDFTYYLMAEDEKELAKIRDNMLILKSRNYNIAIRPHPRYSKMILVISYFSDFFIEDTKSKTIEESFEDTGGIISLYSTVLFQGYYNSKSIIIDDLVNNGNYKKLFKLDYNLLKKPHRLLSQILAATNFEEDRF